MDIQTFASDALGSIRVTLLGGEPQFYAVDLARTLGYSDTQAMTRRIDPEDITTCTDNSSGQVRSYTVLSESGLYAAILGSSKPEAKAFKRWVTGEVLPAIRKTGSYTATPAFQVPQTLSEALRLAADLSDKVEAQAAQIEHQRPAVEFVERFVDTTSLTTLSDAAKEFGYGPKEFTAILVGRKILFRRTKSGPLIARQEHLDAGRFAVKVWMGNGYTKPNTHLTAKGLVWLKGIIPTATTDTFWELEA